MGFCFVFRSHILHSKCMVAILKQQSTKLTIQWNGPRKSSNMFGCGFFITITAISCQYESVKSITESRTWVMVNFPTAKSTSWNYSNVRHTSLYSCFDLIWRHNWGWGGEELYFFKCTLFNQLTWGWGEHGVTQVPIITWGGDNWMNALVLVCQSECCRFFYMKNTTWAPFYCQWQRPICYLQLPVFTRLYKEEDHLITTRLTGIKPTDQLTRPAIETYYSKIKVLIVILQCYIRLYLH